MIAYLSGDVSLVEEQRLVLQTSGGVGYLVQIPQGLGNRQSVYCQALGVSAQGNPLHH